CNLELTVVSDELLVRRLVQAGITVISDVRSDKLLVRRLVQTGLTLGSFLYY
ncbi:7712_t:CDS:2, partial [Dentiscutata erythropus]